MIRECVRYQERLQYLPLYFFTAQTNRVDSHHNPIKALFIKINTEQRAELVTDVSDLHMTLEKNNHKIAVNMHYTIQNIPGMLYVAIRKTLT